MAERVAAERRRDAMIDAWGAGQASPAPAAAGGFQAAAMGLSQRGIRPVAGRGLLDPVPVQVAARRTAPRRADAPRLRFQELAEAPPRRR
jgi:hypothetical protein